MLPKITVADVQFEENDERLKVVLPVHKHWVYLVLYSVMLLTWVGMFIFGLIYTWQTAVSGERFTFAFTVMLLILLYVLYRLGRIVWRQWQYFASNREILFVYKEMLIIRRPVSIFGITTAYDRAHVTPFYYSNDHHCPAFDYGHQHVYLGQDLLPEPAKALIAFLNGRYHPHHDDDDDD
ncbi:MAG: hypothetical protein GY805_19915 [Chloroflexi bacterium]|nr:hypothetical protein [Chloroflexota bacterium]